MMKVFNDRGFSLVQGMILSALLAGTALVTTRMITDQKLAQKGAETRDQIEQLHSLIFNSLQNKDHCTATYFMNGITTSPAPGNTAPVTTINVQATNNFINTASDRPTLFTINNGSSYDPTRIYMNGNVLITYMTLNFGPMDIVPGPPSYTRPSVLEIHYRRLEKGFNTRTKAGFGAKDITKYINIMLQKNSTSGLIDNCYAVEVNDLTGAAGNRDLSSTYCAALGNFFTWNPSLNKCVVAQHVCPIVGQIFTGIDAAGNAVCKSIDDPTFFDWTTLIDTNATACQNATATDVRFIVAGNKVKIFCGNPCVPSPACATLAANYCTTESAGNDNCGNACGNGTKTTAPCSGACIPPGGTDDVLNVTYCCSGTAVNGSTVCSNPADWGTTWASCTHTCQ